MKGIFRKVGSGKDERSSSVLAPIYRTGFYILVFGIVFDLYTRFNYLAQADGGASGSLADSVETAALAAACIYVSVAKCRSGVFSDSMRVLEARSFAETGLAPKAAAFGLLVAVAAVGGRLYNEVVLFGWGGVTWAGDVAMLVVVFAEFAAIALAATYFSWRGYRSREDRLAREEDSWED